MPERREEMWAIVHNTGTGEWLYCGTYLTRVDAIAARVERYYDCPRWMNGQSPRGLRRDQRNYWARLKRQGDKAVRVTVTWEG